MQAPADVSKRAINRATPREIGTELVRVDVSCLNTCGQSGAEMFNGCLGGSRS